MKCIKYEQKNWLYSWNVHELTYILYIYIYIYIYKSNWTKSFWTEPKKNSTDTKSSSIFPPLKKKHLSLKKTVHWTKTHKWSAMWPSWRCPGRVRLTPQSPCSRDEPIIFQPARGTLRRGFIRDSWLLLHRNLDRIKGGRGKINIW